MDRTDRRRLETYRRERGFSRFGCFGPADPDRPLKRYAAEISFEDASDVSDYWVDFDSFSEAEQYYRAQRIVDLDTGASWNVEWLQRAVPTAVLRRA